MTTASPLVSIITPSFQQGRFLQENIRSIQNQDFVDIEHIVIDGGSSDETMAILTALGARVTWVSERDAGQANALNKGIRMSHGQIIGWVNSDDYLYPLAVRSAVEAFANDVDAVYGQCQLVDSGGRAVGMYKTAPFDYKQLVFANLIAQPALFFRRSLFDSIGPFNESLQCAIDYEYWLRCGPRAKFKYRPELFAAYRLHGDAKTSRRAWLMAQEANAARRLYGGPYVSRASLLVANARSMAGGLFKSTVFGSWLMQNVVWRDFLGPGG